MKSKLLTIAFAAFAMMVAPQAQGAISYALTFDGCTGGCGSGPFGSILLTALDSQTIDVKVTLNPGFDFVNTGAGNAIQFRIIGDPVTISVITPGFATAAPKTSGPLSGFNYAIECLNTAAGCGSGGSNPNPGPLEFTVFRATGFGGISEASLIGNNPTNNYFFSADIKGAGTGNTGNVFAGGTAVVVPEPLTMSLVGAGLFAIGFWKRKNRRSA